MRVITGSLRGRKLKSPEGFDVRPTSDMVKEAMFSAVQFELEGRVIADLYAGTGQLGVEALSRGAAKVYFVDNHRPSIEIIKSNTAAAELCTGTAVIREMPVAAFIKSVIEPIDAAFLDPPYERGHLKKILPLLAEKMSDKGVIICEHETDCPLPNEVGDFEISKSRRYGKIGVTIYRKTDSKTKDGEDTN